MSSQDEGMMRLMFIEYISSRNPLFLYLVVYRRWYISIVPPGANPGTTKDVDFYAAPTNFDDSFDDNLPPMANWIVCMQNAGPAPTGVYPYTYEDEMDDVNQQGNIVEDEQGSYNEHQGYL